jgi:predicted nucleic acid-binding Zn ribbon protein
MPRSYDQCVRCGKATPWGKSVCRECNPAGLPEPSPSQYHATVFITVLATLVVLAIIAMLLR